MALLSKNFLLRLFSFNSPLWCLSRLSWDWFLKKFTADRVIPDKTLPVYAAIAPWSEKDNTYYFSLLYSVGQAYGFELKTPWKDLSDLQKKFYFWDQINQY